MDGLQDRDYPTALEALKAIADRRTRSAIIRRIDTLVGEPEKQGKPLSGLAGRVPECKGCRTEVSGSVRIENCRTTGARVHGWYTQEGSRKGYICLG